MVFRTTRRSHDERLAHALGVVHIFTKPMVLAKGSVALRYSVIFTHGFGALVKDKNRSMSNIVHAVLDHLAIFIELTGLGPSRQCLCRGQCG